MAKIDQCVQALINNQINAASITSIASIRPAPRHKFLATETQATIASISCLDLN
jgi:hypothetical protein